jgi:hypothetical protein
MVNSNEKYVIYQGRLIPKSILKEVKRGIMQGGVEQVTYELDNDKIFDLMLEFSGVGDSNPIIKYRIKRKVQSVCVPELA